jgi:hypothetical protein
MNLEGRMPNVNVIREGRGSKGIKLIVVNTNPTQPVLLPKNSTPLAV